MNLTLLLASAMMIPCATAFAVEAPPGMSQFNVTCPTSKVLPVMDRAYHECSNGFVNGSCETFIESFRQLIPEYDCQRPFDATQTKNYIVPAVWLAGDGALEDYVRLLSRLSSTKDKTLTPKYFSKAIMSARELFGSKQFQRVLDGAMAEKYLPISRSVEKQLAKEHK
jgi:hypothetical protein